MEEHARRRGELLVVLRTIKGGILDGGTGRAQQPAADLVSSETALATIIPIEAAPHRSSILEVGAVPAVDRWRHDVLGTAVRPTKHDYDYFGELDRTLSRRKRPQ